MTTPELESPPAIPASIGGRILYGVAGVVVLVGGAFVTLGAALAGAVSIVIASFIMRRRRRQLTRVGAWVASVAGTILAMALLLGGGMLMSPPPSTEVSAKEYAESQARAREKMPEWLKTKAQQNGRQAAADSMAQRLLRNRGAMVWIAAVGTMIGSAMLGAIAGTIGWGAAMLLYRASRGHWLRSEADDLTPEPIF